LLGHFIRVLSGRGPHFNHHTFIGPQAALLFGKKDRVSIFLALP